jgi:hypothetical protein
VDDEIRAWNPTPHSGVWFSTELPSGIRKSAPLRLGLDFLDSPSSLTFFGHSTSRHPFLAAQPLALSGTDLTTNQDKSSKTSPEIRTGSSLLLVRPSQFGFLSFSALNGLAASAHRDRIIVHCIF